MTPTRPQPGGRTWASQRRSTGDPPAPAPASVATPAPVNTPVCVDTHVTSPVGVYIVPLS